MDMQNDACTSCSKSELVPRRRRTRHKHAHGARQARPSLLTRIAGHAFMLLLLRLSVQTVLREVADEFLRLRRLAADRADDGLHERCSHLVTADLQDDE